MQSDRHIAGSQGARKQVQTAITPGINWNDKALNDKLKVLILDVLKEQGILQQKWSGGGIGKRNSKVR